MKRCYLFLLLICFVLSACSNDKPVKTDSDSKTAVQEQYGKPMPPISDGEFGEKERDFLRYPGKYSGNKYNETAIKAEMDKVPANWTKEQYLQFLYSLAAEDYRTDIKNFQNLSTDINTNLPKVNGKIALPENKKVYFSILLDASGSMKAKIGNKTKMDIAKEAVQKFAATLPSNANISLRVYGHKGTGSQSDKAASCNSTEEIYQSNGYQASEFQSALQSIQPSGWTPIAKALDGVAQNIGSRAKDVDTASVKSYVYVVSDGVETCDGNPVEAAKKLNQSNVKTIVNIIGFNVESKGTASLKQVAVAGGGEYISVNNAVELNDYLNKQQKALINQWRDWMQQSADQADDMENEIREKGKVLDKQMSNHAEMEYTRLMRLKDWLKESVAKKLDKNNLPSNHPASLIYIDIIERKGKIRTYANDRRYDKFMEGIEKKGQEKHDIYDEGEDKINDLNKQKRDALTQNG
jgi:D-amino-acid dehydrogenase/Ca-activated chloride channel family protein